MFTYCILPTPLFVPKYSLAIDNRSINIVELNVFMVILEY